MDMKDERLEINKEKIYNLLEMIRAALQSSLEAKRNIKQEMKEQI